MTRLQSRMERHTVSFPSTFQHGMRPPYPVKCNVIYTGTTVYLPSQLQAARNLAVRRRSVVQHRYHAIVVMAGAPPRVVLHLQLGVEQTVQDPIACGSEIRKQVQTVDNKEQHLAGLPTPIRP